MKPEIIVENPASDDEKLEVVLESKSRGVISQQVEVYRENGKLRYSMPEIDRDDQYILKMKDHTLENHYEEAVSFSVNHRGTVFTYDREKANVKLDKSFIPRIHLQNVDATQVVSCMVNGKESPYEEKRDELVISEDSLKNGKNQIIVAVKDQAGNVSVMPPWEFMISDMENRDREKGEQRNIFRSPVYMVCSVFKMIVKILSSSI